MARAATMQALEPGLTHEQIAAIARDLWRARGCPAGSPERDWFEAEEILKANQTAEDMVLGDQGQSGG